MKKYLGILLLAISTTSLTSCLKDGPVNLPPGGSPPVIEFSTNLFVAPTSDVNSPVALYTKSYDVVPSATLELTIGYTGGAPAPEDITVNLDNDGADKIAAYNEYKDANYEMLPAEFFSGMPSSVVIKKGENFAKFTVTVKPDQFDFAKSYALPFHIASVSSGTVSGNYGTILVSVGAKNKYDGVYKVTGSYHDLSFPAYTGYFPYTADLETISAGTVDVFNEDLGTYGFLFYTNNANGDISYYGSFSPEFTFDPATNKIIKVENAYGQLAGANKRSAELDPSGVNEYDPATKTFKVKYFMYQLGAKRLTFDETYTYQGPRP
ncbi:DUF1735 domain-containing protein [Mucilaginibacter sp. 14171R-50]|uniref:DUF1735 domain-containing protein n=1 Tax=Mucilaginibacter sp. 14171R-50 TaxID=2703789 RepID=UPI00138C6ADA|nr:DUF1735 domain-containing protein [Mucilaginibacter sp. 14171R-50]QHS54997.1 DUF1735 domain-containing protein [Mucilaginibacter sp. 14171R-50]